MRVSRIRIENFRSIKDLTIELGATTVFIGANNAGKTAILDAIRLALTRRWGQRGTGFTEYDIHLDSDTDDPKASPGVAIEIVSEEQPDDLWPDELKQALADLVQTDPATGIDSITLRIQYAWSAANKIYEPSWSFLNAARQAMVGGAARRLNFERFWQFIPVFYLNALRNADEEFSSRSQFWGRLLKSIDIPEKLEAKVQKVLELLNRKLLNADPKLGAIATTLTGATKVAAGDQQGGVEMRLLPLKPWDLLSKAEVILRNEATSPWLPLNRQGQGMQSLSVIFLFHAFVEHLLSEIYEPESEPVLLLEEPETHLHPQAARSLWTHVSAVPGQKAITTHSPYFVQHVPFRDIRLVRLTGTGTTVSWLPPTFSATIISTPEMLAAVDASNGLLSFDRISQRLTVHGKLNENTYRSLLAAYGTHPDRVVISGVLRQLKDQSLLHISDDELRSLETFARRIRGEIFFAKRWMLVEGQAEYLIVHALAHAMNYDLDEHGVSVIDAVNNGNPATFAALARAFSIPWLAVFDGDPQGKKYCDQIKARDFTDAVVSAKCTQHAERHLEAQLLANGLEAELRSVLAALGQSDAAALTRPELEARLDNYKTAYSAELASRILARPALVEQMPVRFRDAIEALRTLA
jgi:putative ATP-dependent endonuclease of OLD family